MKRLLVYIVNLLALAIALMLLISVGAGYLDPRSYGIVAPLVLVSGFVAIVALVALVVCLAMRNLKASLTLGVALLISMPTMRLQFPLRLGSKPDNTDRTFTVLTWNVCIFEDMIGIDEEGTTIKHILEVDADVVMLQETSSYSGDYLDQPETALYRSQVEQRYPYRSSSYRDLVVWSKTPYTVLPDTTMKNNKSMVEGDSSYHYYGKVFDLTVKGHQLRMIDLHLQSIGLTPDDKQLYRDLASLNKRVKTEDELREVKHTLWDKISGASQRRAAEAQCVRAILDNSPGNVIVCGDFNDVAGSYSYYTVRGDDMHDAFAGAATHPAYSFNRDQLFFRIDHMLYRGDMRAVSSRIDKAGSSDHYPIITTFEWNE